MIDLIIIIYYLISITYLIYNIKKDFISLPNLFLISQLVMFSGITMQMNKNVLADRILIIMYTIALIMFILGVSFCKKLKKGKVVSISYNYNYVPNKYQFQMIYLIVFISILACLYLFRAVGTNLFVNIIKTLASSGELDNITESRLSFYGVSGIGYIYQFRVILLPVLTIFLFSFCKKNFSTWALFILMITFLLGTGQRGGFFTFGLTWLLILLTEGQLRGNRFNKKIVGVFILVISLFCIMTIANGRITSENKNIIGAIIQRFTNDNQITAIYGFRYIYNQPTQWGLDWLNMFKDILPGKNSYLPVANRIFATMYGSTRGTAPPCIWGSVYYNWGLIGIIVIPFFMGLIYRLIYCRLFRREINPLRLTIYSAIFVSLGMWAADAPITLFNQGFIALCILAFILHIDKGDIVKGKIYE